jgi:hypothetical protein
MNKYFDYWYQPRMRLSSEEWLYIAVLAVSWIASWGVGLLLGGLWLLML